MNVDSYEQDKNVVQIPYDEENQFLNANKEIKENIRICSFSCNTLPIL